ncbi:reprolysin-like metallopeptidase [Ulvibacterium marinum]|uniref:zinc-dependent metalloprotease n=1 Tax=Ulvibacterium marinum TaxID=2419782 RepID=UPI002494BAB3|nr:zinc-dependent metalloprotease family protein [Ulvibacterium marinum]
MATKLRLVFSITILFLSFYVSGQQKHWQKETSGNVAIGKVYQRFQIKKGTFFSFKEKDFKAELQSFPKSGKRTKIINFPNESGKSIPFRVSNAQTLSPELAAKYPFIKSYVGHSLDGQEKIRFSVSHKGIQSMIVHADGKGNTFMQKTGDGKYVVYKREGNASQDMDFVCSTLPTVQKNIGRAMRPVTGQVLRKFRLAVSATGEYTDHHGGTVADALAAINATVTRVNEVFETDLAITLELVANNDQVIFPDADTDPYDGNLNFQVQTTLNDIIGAENYDIGHLFHDDVAGGNAGFVGSVCIDNRKGSAFAASPEPEGDIFDLDFVAHEMGHQFGANHTWSFESEGTQVQAEPASGTTIMGYAGITLNNDVAPNGDDYFHYYSIVQIADYLESVSCAETDPLTNNPPVIAPVGNFTIPKSTAFALTGSASDSDVGDVLTYNWEQVDDGVVNRATFGPTNPGGANFRSLKPSLDSTRYFPRLSRVLEGNLTQTNPPEGSAWETVSDVEREMNFALTVRDNAMGGGQVVSDLVNVVVTNSAGPFMVTSQANNEIYAAGSVQEVTWDVADTDNAVVNAQTVDILLSIDGGLTFPMPLAENVVNDGSHNVVIPGDATTQARIMVKANNNIFFAVNSTDFTIQASEVVLNFSNLEYEVCQSDDLIVTFNYETFLGFNEESTFSVPTPPAGLDISFSPETAIADGTSVDIIFSNTAGVATGSYTIPVLATSISQSTEITLELNVYNTSFSEVALVSPADGSTDTSTGIPLEWEENPLYASYDIEVATDVAFSNIVESATVLSNSYLPSNLDNETTYFWRVKPKNPCGEGIFGSPFSFTTIQFNCKNETGSGLPLAISSTGTPTIVSKIAFFEDLALADINVRLDLDHTFLADLVVSLTSPSGTTVVLVSSSCGELNNIDAIFDDSATSFVCGGNPAIGGTVKPLGSLSSFNGESILGEWTLTISDNAPSDGGTLKAFSLEVCIEGEFGPDEDNDGIFDQDDLCPGTPAGAEVDSSGCPVYRFPSTNFSIAIQSTACRNSADGSLQVSANLPLDYTIAIIGNGTNESDTFTNSYTFGGLAPGVYEVCIGGSDGTIDYLEHCFEVVISEPDPLSVSSKISADGKQAILEMDGSDMYTIELNGEGIRTDESAIALDLKNGINTLKVSTNKTCQGIYEERIFVSDGPIVYPNPFGDFITIFIGETPRELTIKVYALNGRLVHNGKYQVNGTELVLDLSTLPSGTYLMRYRGEGITGASKIVKR